MFNNLYIYHVMFQFSRGLIRKLIAPANRKAAKAQWLNESVRMALVYCQETCEEYVLRRHKYIYNCVKFDIVL